MSFVVPYTDIGFGRIILFVRNSFFAVKNIVRADMDETNVVFPAQVSDNPGTIGIYPFCQFSFVFTSVNIRYCGKIDQNIGAILFDMAFP